MCIFAQQLRENTPVMFENIWFTAIRQDKKY